MTPDEKKRAAALAALKYVEPDSIIGVGTGSTVNHFIDALAEMRDRIQGAVSSSEASTERLRAKGITVLSLNNVGNIPLYVDGADEATRYGYLIKGGGGALTREKIVAAASKCFICIIDDSKQVDVLGRFPLPIEVIPMARSYVARQVSALGGQPVWREGVITDNGNMLLDVHHLNIVDAVKMESELNQIAGVVTNGIFARRPADILLVATNNGIVTLDL